MREIKSSNIAKRYDKNNIYLWKKRNINRARIEWNQFFRKLKLRIPRFAKAGNSKQYNELSNFIGIEGN